MEAFSVFKIMPLDAMFSSSKSSRVYFMLAQFSFKNTYKLSFETHGLGGALNEHFLIYLFVFLL